MQTTELSVGKQGRIVIPANIRNQLAIETGTQLVAWVDEGRLIMESKQQLWQSIYQACGKTIEEVDLVQELLDERRESAKNENS